MPEAEAYFTIDIVGGPATGKSALLAALHPIDTQPPVPIRIRTRNGPPCPSQAHYTIILNTQFRGLPVWEPPRETWRWGGSTAEEHRAKIVEEIGGWLRRGRPPVDQPATTRYC